MNPDNLPQPPEGVLDPKIPWSRINPNSRLWVTLKARLTGRPQDGENYSSYVNISEADADRLIENLKKDPRGYPSLDQAGGNPIQWMENQRLYQEWLVEEYLEKPFREQTNKKIEEAEVESRLNEIQEEKKKKKQEEEQKKKEEEQKELDQDQEELENQIDDLTEDIDSELEPPKDSTENSDTVEPEVEPPEEKTDDSISDVRDSLEQIKGSLKVQVSDLETINKNDSLSIASLETLKQLFQTQNDIFRRSLEKSELKQEEASLEQSKDVSATQEATDLTADNKAEGIIQGVDGNVITVKTTDGEFKQGQKISQGGGGGGFFDMLKGIAGKFLTKGKGGGGASPTKMSSGGFVSAGIPTPLSEGTIAPGVYNKPTRGTLGMNQMVIPLNRNVGKPFKQDKTDTRARKFDQPMIDVMSQPLKAIGLSILSVAGNFLQALGPLAGFFLPYATGLVKGFAAILGVPATLIMSLLGGPAYAAMDQQNKQQNIFAKLWSDLMQKFGFDLGGEDDKDKKKKKREGNTPSTATGKWGPLLDVIASGEGNYDSLNPSLKRPEIVDMTISELVAFQKESKAKHGGTAAAGRYQMLHPESYAQKAGLSMDEKFSPENQDKMAANYIENVRGGKDWLAGKLTDEDFGKELAMEWAALEYPGKGGGFYDGDGRNKAKVSWEKVKAVLPQVKAEKGVQMKDNSAGVGKVMGWKIIDGPDSGYKVNDNLTMHGQEAYLQHENGFSILPIENNEYSLTKNPDKTMNRWKEILGTKSTGSKTSFASGGSRASQQRSRLGVQKVNGRWANMGVSDAAVGKNAWWQVWNKKGATADRRAKQEALAKSLTERLNTEEGLNRPRQQTPTAAPSSTPRQRPSFASIASKPAATTPAKPKEKTETDLMMEQYNQLVAAGKQTEAKELGMNIWNKTWKQTSKGLERIPSTPLPATSATPSQPAPSQPITPSTSNSPAIITLPAPQAPIIISVMSDARVDFNTQVERRFA